MICEPWTTEAEVAACNCEPGSVSPERLADLIDAASEILYLLSGSQFSGTCTRTLRPCHSLGSRAWPTSLPTSGLSTPALIDGEWWNLGGCGCGSTWNSCTCGRAQALLLPVDHPTSATVKIDGVAVTDFRLDGRSLWRRSWPCCQDLSLPDTEPGTWSVTVTHGLPVPASGRLAASALTAELVKACVSDKSCRLPFGASTVVRQGVTIDSAQFGDMLRLGSLGIAEVDLFLAAVNPNGLRRRGRFISPDVPATLG